MAEASFEFNDDAMKELGRQSVAAFNAKMQPVLDQVFEGYANRPEPDVRQAVEDAWRDNGQEASAEFLDMVAPQIAEGKHVALKNAA